MTAEQLSQLLDELGRRLGPTGSHVFELAVRQQILTGVIWSALLLTGAAAAGVTALVLVRRVKRLESVIGSIQAAFDKRDVEFADATKAAREFRREKEAADLAAMTPKQRAAWYARMSGLMGYGLYSSGYSSRTDLSELSDANGWRLVAAAVLGLFAFFCIVIAAAGPVPALLNPEYAALRDLLGAIKP